MPFRSKVTPRSCPHTHHTQPQHTETRAFAKEIRFFLGTTFFIIPFCIVIIYFSFIYVKDSFVINEASASMVGLPYRWVIKSFLLFGFTLALLSGISVWLQTFICLFGRPDYRFDLMTLNWPEEKNQKAQDFEDIEKTLDTKSE